MKKVHIVVLEYDNTYLWDYVYFETKKEVISKYKLIKSNLINDKYTIRIYYNILINKVKHKDILDKIKLFLFKNHFRYEIKK